MIGLPGLSPTDLREGDRVLARLLVKSDPVACALPTALEIAVDLQPLPLSPAHVLPRRGGFGHKRVVIGIIVARR